MAYCTADEVKQYLGRPATDIANDPLFTDLLIPGASSFIEEYCNRKFDRKQVTEYYQGGSNKIFLKRYPVDLKKTITIWDSWDRTYESGDLIPATDYYVDEEAGIVTFDYEVGGTAGAVKIIYTGGELAVPKDIKQACIELVARRFKDGVSGGLGVPTRAIPSGGSVSFVIDAILPQTKMILDMYRR